MQRVRIGLTGLAFVFLLVLLAAVFAPPSSEAPLTPAAVENGVEDAATNELANVVTPNEPLAELGVAPGNADSNLAAAAAN